MNSRIILWSPEANPTGSSHAKRTTGAEQSEAIYEDGQIERVRLFHISYRRLLNTLDLENKTYSIWQIMWTYYAVYKTSLKGHIYRTTENWNCPDAHRRVVIDCWWDLQRWSFIGTNWTKTVNARGEITKDRAMGWRHLWLDIAR